jgi:hypothetical protein
MVWGNPEKLEEIVSQALFSLRLRLGMGDVNCAKTILTDRVSLTCEPSDVTARLTHESLPTAKAAHAAMACSSRRSETSDGVGFDSLISAAVAPGQDASAAWPQAQSLARQAHQQGLSSVSSCGSG